LQFEASEKKKIGAGTLMGMPFHFRRLGFLLLRPGHRHDLAYLTIPSTDVAAGREFLSGMPLVLS
jgi:hypothetical protein